MTGWQKALGAALVLIPGLAEAGPWPAGRGHSYTKVSYGYLTTRTLATPDGTIAEINRFTRSDTWVYGAFGASDRLTLLISSGLYRRSSIEGFGSADGIGDVQLGLQLQAGRRGPWIFALRGLVQAPIGDETKGEGVLPTGSGAWEGEVMFSAGSSVAGGRGWGFVEVGHQPRGSGLRDAFAYGAQVGFAVRPNLLVAWNVRGVEPYRSGPSDAALRSYAGLGDGVTYVTQGPTAILKLDSRWALQLDVDGGFHARNLAKGLVWRAGVSFAR